jgi:dihydroneopterin aldolase
MAPKELQCLQTDTLADAIDYTLVAEVCAEVARHGQYHLLEALAYAVAKRLLMDFALGWVRLHVRKPKPLPHLASSVVELLLHRHDLDG